MDSKVKFHVTKTLQTSRVIQRVKCYTKYQHSQNSQISGPELSCFMVSTITLCIPQARAPGAVVESPSREEKAEKDHS